MTTVRSRVPVDLRFWAKVRKTDECWEWLAYRGREGYGRFRVFGRTPQLAHRIAWELVNGSIPQGLVIDHQCRNRACVRPDHLRVVTQRVNSTENVVGSCWQLHRAKTHCPHGHEYSVVNTHWYKGWRWCRACNLAHTHRSRGKTSVAE